MRLKTTHEKTGMVTIRTFSPTDDGFVMVNTKMITGIVIKKSFQSMKAEGKNVEAKRFFKRNA